jgi:hypothetical protein
MTLFAVRTSSLRSCYLFRSKQTFNNMNISSLLNPEPAENPPDEPAHTNDWPRTESYFDFSTGNYATRSPRTGPVPLSPAPVTVHRTTTKSKAKRWKAKRWMTEYDIELLKSVNLSESWQHIGDTLGQTAEICAERYAYR